MSFWRENSLQLLTLNELTWHDQGVVWVNFGFLRTMVNFFHGFLVNWQSTVTLSNLHNFWRPIIIIDVVMMTTTTTTVWDLLDKRLHWLCRPAFLESNPLILNTQSWTGAILAFAWIRVTYAIGLIIVWKTWSVVIVFFAHLQSWDVWKHIQGGVYNMNGFERGVGLYELTKVIKMETQTPSFSTT